jgi:hypothetical protein
VCSATSGCRTTGAVRLSDGDLGNRAILFFILTAIQYTDLWHGVLRRTRRGPRVWCLRLGDESEVESDGGRGEAPARCVLAVATARQPTRGPYSVVSLCRMVGTVVAALRRRVLHGGGLFGAELSVFLLSLSVLDCILAATSRAGEGCLLHRLGFVRPGLPCGMVLTVLMPQSNRSGPLKVV